MRSECSAPLPRKMLTFFTQAPKNWPRYPWPRASCRILAHGICVQSYGSIHTLSEKGVRLAKKCKLAHAVRWQYQKMLKLARLLGRLGIFLTDGVCIIACDRMEVYVGGPSDAPPPPQARSRHRRRSSRPRPSCACPMVWARPGGPLSALRVPHNISMFSMAFLCGRAGRLTAQNGEFRPGQKTSPRASRAAGRRGGALACCAGGARRGPRCHAARLFAGPVGTLRVKQNGARENASSALVTRPRKTPSWLRSWANFSPL
jgi:hypothetical protein